MTERFSNSSMPDVAAGAAPGAAGFVVDVSGEDEFRALVEKSMTVPVVIDLWATWCEPCKQLSPILEQVTAELGGRVLLAKIDVDANQQIAAAFGAQSVPTVVALVKGQPVPLFQGAIPKPQVMNYFEELLKAAKTVGVEGVVAGEQPAPPAIPPLHQVGYDAIESGDLAAAKAAFTQALIDSPGDRTAKAALAQTELLERLDKAAASPDAVAGVDGTVEATLAAADGDVSAGRASEGFGRLLDAMAGADPEAKEELRLRLLSLFEVVGDSDPAVAAARRRLASLLF
jgi:putative thioredoxin